MSVEASSISSFPEPEENLTDELMRFSTPDNNPDAAGESPFGRFEELALKPLMNHHARVVEKLNHKQALYSDLARMAVTHETRISQQEVSDRLDQFAAAYGVSVRGRENERLPEPLNNDTLMNRIRLTGIPLNRGEFAAAPTIDGQPAVPLSPAETYMEWRINRQARKKSKADVTLYRERKVFEGPVDAQGNPNIKPVLGEEIPMTALQNRLAGMSRKEKRDAKAEIEQGLTSHEAKLQKLSIDATRSKLGSEMIKGAFRKQSRANKNLRKLTGQSHIGRYRDKRLFKSSQKLESLSEQYNQRLEGEPLPAKVRTARDFMDDASDSTRTRKDGIVMRDVRMTDYRYTPNIRLGQAGTTELSIERQAAEKKAAESPSAIRTQRKIDDFRKDLRRREEVQRRRQEKARVRIEEEHRVQEEKTASAILRQDDKDWEREAKKKVASLTPYEQLTLRRIDQEVYTALNGIDKKDWKEIRKQIYEKHYGPLTDKQASEIFEVIRVMTKLAGEETQNQD